MTRRHANNAEISHAPSVPGNKLTLSLSKKPEPGYLSQELLTYNNLNRCVDSVLISIAKSFWICYSCRFLWKTIKILPSSQKQFSQISNAGVYRNISTWKIMKAQPNLIFLWTSAILRDYNFYWLVFLCPLNLIPSSDYLTPPQSILSKWLVPNLKNGNLDNFQCSKSTLSVIWKHYFWKLWPVLMTFHQIPE